MCFDEPSCLQLCNVSKCESRRFLDLKGCKMGSNGAFLVAVKVKEHCERLELLDVSGISMGPITSARHWPTRSPPCTRCACRTTR
mmetsp:Transcript_18442/g.25379  ORF Transcript_18442/g.25379 Transcript_18442/m.25379 type:complete len:85 (+) Transcript_18442:1212-1466(+)